MARSKKNEEKYLEISEIIKKLLSQHLGEENKILRGELLFKIKFEWNLNHDKILILGDRRMRIIIEDLRANDLYCSRICSTPDNNGGYWIAENRAELLRNLKSDKDRIFHTYQRIRMQRINSINAFAAENDFKSLKQMSLIK